LKRGTIIPNGKEMGMVKIIILMVKNMLGILLTKRKMGMVLIHLRMGILIMDIGKMINNMEEEHNILQIILNSKEIG
jgi:hypothetical protein